MTLMPVKGISCSKIALQDVVGSYCGRDSVLTEADIAASRNAPMEGADVRGYNMFMLGVNRYFAITSLLFFCFVAHCPRYTGPLSGGMDLCHATSSADRRRTTAGCSCATFLVSPRSASRS